MIIFGLHTDCFIIETSAPVSMRAIIFSENVSEILIKTNGRVFFDGFNVSENAGPYHLLDDSVQYRFLTHLQLAHLHFCLTDYSLDLCLNLNWEHIDDSHNNSDSSAMNCCFGRGNLHYYHNYCFH